MAYAHSANSAGQRHDLVDHLTAVAHLARSFAEAWGGGDAAYYAGLWHDLGKFHPDWQTYLLASERDPGAKVKGPAHSHVGALLAAECSLEPLAFPVAGHHSGLPDHETLRNRLRAGGDIAFPDGRRAREALAEARRQMGRLEPEAAGAVFPADFHTETEVELFLRFLFSALVDADSLDAERHDSPQQAADRGSSASLRDLLQRLMEDQALRFARPRSAVEEMRDLAYRRCLEAAEDPSGIYRLTVPTGGGKTRSGLAFALKHAVLHDKRRVIVAIPYTSIIEQTAAVFREALGNEEAVLEHHSAAGWKAEAALREAEAASEDPSHSWQRLAAENWDAPVVVTTFVQLFESLLSNRRGDCRKLHNIAGSVLVLDEVQTLPVRLLSPLLDVLRQLVGRYGVTVVLCSATLSAFGAEELGKDALPEAHEIVPEHEGFFLDERLQRVRYELRQGEPWDWARLAQEVRGLARCMVVLNTRPQALSLLEAFGPEASPVHLSTFLCPAHRRDVLTDVKASLAAGEPCLLVTTQVVETGVDLDFPAVFRAMGPLDRIVQAAGRCNREGGLPDKGLVVVFEPADGALPERSGPYESGTRIARRLLSDGRAQKLFDPTLYRRYFRELFPSQELDASGIQGLRGRLDYPEVAQRSKLIEEDEESVVVRYPEDNMRVDALIEDVRTGRGNPRQLLRALQPYMVGVRRGQLRGLETERLIRPMRPGLWEWHGQYDPVRGIAGSQPSYWVG